MSDRPSPARLELSNYPVIFDVPTRFGDLDMQGHINNVSFAGLFEDARMRFNMQIRSAASMEDLQPEGRFVLVSSNFQFIHEGSYPEPAVIGIGVSKIGNSSYQLACGMFQQQRCVALNDVCIVNSHMSKGLALPDVARTRLQKLAFAAARLE